LQPIVLLCRDQVVNVAVEHKHRQRARVILLGQLAGPAREPLPGTRDRLRHAQLLTRARPCELASGWGSATSSLLSGAANAKMASTSLTFCSVCSTSCTR